MHQKCHGKFDSDLLILCDHCDREIHTYCFNPPLPAVPDEDPWFCCEHCIRDQAGANEDGWPCDRVDSMMGEATGEVCGESAGCAEISVSKGSGAEDTDRSLVVTEENLHSIHFVNGVDDGSDRLDMKSVLYLLL